MLFTSSDANGKYDADHCGENQRDDEVTRALVNTTFEERVDVLKEDVGWNREDPGNGGEEETDGGIDDDIGDGISVKMIRGVVHPLPEIMQLANHLIKIIINW